nr:septal ring lytic transglycosylase RlpA family protein [Bradyrhizobium sp. 132]
MRGPGPTGSGAVRAQTTLFSCLATFSLSAVSFAHAESGLASYYGYGKAGKGELTCAHRTRPFGSVLRVSYGSRSIQCRVNDRGPFIRGRIVDLSVPAARALGMMSAGVVRVSVE